MERMLLDTHRHTLVTCVRIVLGSCPHDIVSCHSCLVVQYTTVGVLVFCGVVWKKSQIPTARILGKKKWKKKVGDVWLVVLVFLVSSCLSSLVPPLVPPLNVLCG